MPRPESEDKRSGDYQQHPREQMVHQVSPGIDMLHAHQMQPEPQAQDNAQQRQQNQKQGLLRR